MSSSKAQLSQELSTTSAVAAVPMVTTCQTALMPSSSTALWFSTEWPILGKALIPPKRPQESGGCSGAASSEAVRKAPRSQSSGGPPSPRPRRPPGRKPASGPGPGAPRKRCSSPGSSLHAGSPTQHLWSKALRGALGKVVFALQSSRQSDASRAVELGPGAVRSPELYRARWTRIPFCDEAASLRIALQSERHRPSSAAPRDGTVMGEGQVGRIHHILA